MKNGRRGFSNGLIIKIKNKYYYFFIHNFNTNSGCSGGVIVNRNNNCIIGIHKGGFKNKNNKMNNKNANVGIFIYNIINDIIFQNNIENESKKIISNNSNIPLEKNINKILNLKKNSGFQLKEYEQNIENWTNKKIKSIVFDSDIDNWNTGRDFSKYIIGKSNLLFMIDDMENNRFGGYISSQITKTDEYIDDPKAFIFSLQSNKRLSQPAKFGIKSPEYAFISLTTHDRYIFAFGAGFDIKLDRKETS